jgi:hypothetical protein
MVETPKAVEPPLTRDEIAAVARSAGLSLRPEHFEDLVQAYGHLHAMLQRLPREHAYGAEPAHVFDPRKLSPKGQP